MKLSRSAQPLSLLPFDGQAFYWNHVLSVPEAMKYFSTIRGKTSWQQREIWMFGKKVMQPRLVAWYGDPECSYSYSGIKWEPLPWYQELDELRQKLETLTKVHYNSALLNLYRDGRDSMGAHSDDEKELGVRPTIASVSFGATRKFIFRHKTKGNCKVAIDLESGSVLQMSGETQNFWKHEIVKTKVNVEPRINITFRNIKF